MIDVTYFDPLNSSSKEKWKHLVQNLSSRLGKPKAAWIRNQKSVTIALKSERETRNPLPEKTYLLQNCPALV